MFLNLSLLCARLKDLKVGELNSKGTQRLLRRTNSEQIYNYNKVLGGDEKSGGRRKDLFLSVSSKVSPASWFGTKLCFSYVTEHKSTRVWAFKPKCRKCGVGQIYLGFVSDWLLFISHLLFPNHRFSRGVIVFYTISLTTLHLLVTTSADLGDRHMAMFYRLWN